MAEAMKASLLLTLEDQLSGGVNHLMETIDKLIATTERLQTGFGQMTDRLDGMFSKTSEKVEKLKHDISPLGEMIESIGQKWHAMTEAMANSPLGQAATKIGALGALGGGFALTEPVRAYADYENILRHIAITEGKSGEGVTPEIDRLTKLFAGDAQHTGQSSESIAKAYYDLVTTGIPASILDRVIGAHSQAATAYNISPEALGPAVGALLQNFHIPEADIGSALSALAQAAKEGRFKVEDFSRELPGVSGFMSTLGMTGREGADVGFAALETVMKNAANPGQAAADFSDALNYLTGMAAKRAFRQSGVDLPELLEAGEKAGKNPLDTILDKLTEMTRGQDPVKMAETLHAVLHNQQAEQALMALLQHRTEFSALKGKLDQVDPAQVLRDFQTAVADPITQIRLLDENLAQLNRTAGELFAPTLKGVADDLGGLKTGFDWMSANFPTLTKGMGDATGKFLEVTAALGALGFAVPYVTAGLEAMGAVLTFALSPGGALFALGVGMVAATDFLINHPNAALSPNNPLYKPDASIQPGQTHLPGLGLPSEVRHGGDSFGSSFRPLQLNVHVTADPGLNATATTPDSSTVQLGTPSDDTHTVGRP